MLAGTACILTYRRDASIGSNLARGAVAAIVFPSAMAAPGMFAAHEEFRTGFTTPTESGKDHGVVLETFLGNSALHGSHHRHPHLAHPLEGYGRDRRLNSLLERIGLVKVTDGVPADNQDRTAQYSPHDYATI
jgi:hypothetical protein